MAELLQLIEIGKGKSPSPQQWGLLGWINCYFLVITLYQVIRLDIGREMNYGYVLPNLVFC